jgi:hypothetical protein
MSEPQVVVRRPIDDARERVQEGERELSAILTNMWENGEVLVRQEMDLGLKEIDIRVDKLKQSLLMGTIGGATLYAGILVLLAAVVLGLSKVMEPWLAALIVGVVITGAGALLVTRGEAKAEEAVKPDDHSRRTVRAMKEAIK